MKYLPFLWGVLLACLMSVSCKKEIIASQWADESMKIDGGCLDWESGLVYKEDHDISFGIKNDDQTIYLIFITDDQAMLQQMMMNGLVIWLDEEGDKEKEIGFKYPRGLVERGLPAHDIMRALRTPDGQIDEKQFQRFIDQQFRDIQVLGKKGENRGIYTHREAEDFNVKFKLTYSKNQLIYEMCFPSTGPEKHPWTLSNAQNIGIGIEQPEMEGSHFGRGPSMGGGTMDASGGSTGGGGRGGGRGGRGGGMPSGGAEGGMDAAPTPGMGGGFHAAKPLKVWMTVTLAAK